MTKKRIADLIEQAVKQPAPLPPAENSALAKPAHQGIAITRNTQLAELKLTSQGLFDECKALWEGYVAFV